MTNAPMDPNYIYIIFGLSVIGIFTFKPDLLTVQQSFRVVAGICVVEFRSWDRPPLYSASAFNCWRVIGTAPYAGLFPTVLEVVPSYCPSFANRRGVQLESRPSQGPFVCPCLCLWWVVYLWSSGVRSGKVGEGWLVNPTRGPKALAADSPVSF